MNIRELSNTILLSNKNVEKLARKLINESCNAVLMEMYEDKCYLADHKTGQIFEANYSFDGNTFVFENFNEIQVEKSDSSLREAISDYFDDKNISLTEAYESCNNNSSEAFEDSLLEALSSKSGENIVDYSSLEGINEELGELKENETFKTYADRLETNPMESITYFNWKDPVKVSMIDEDTDVILNKSIFNKAKKLRSSVEFKKNLQEASEEFVNGNNELLEELISDNDSIVALSESDLKELVGLSVIGNKELMDSRKQIVEAVENFISEDAALSEKRAAVEAEKTADKGENEELEAPEQDVAAIKSALEKAKEKATDEKLINKIEGLIDSLEESIEDGNTNVGVIKEAVRILTM